MNHIVTGKVVVDVAMSLDGYIGGPSDQPERLHDWMFPASGQVDAANAAVIAASQQRYGAIVMGRHAYNLAEQYDGFVDNPYPVPHYILTHTPPSQVAKGNTAIHFVTAGIHHALEQAKAAAGSKDVAIAGGADVIQQALAAGLADEIAIALVPVLFGRGVRLFDTLPARTELEVIQTVDAPGVTHLRYHLRQDI